MKVKKFTASNNQEALMKVRAELGPDAVILHQRKVKPKGIFGSFKKPVIEVVAAIEEVTPFKAEPVKTNPILKLSETSLKTTHNRTEISNMNMFKQTEAITKPTYERNNVNNTDTIKAPNNTYQSSLQTSEVSKTNATITPKEKLMTTEEKMKMNETDKVIAKEISEIKSMLRTVIQKVNQEQLPMIIKNLNNEEMNKLYSILKEQEVEDELIERIVQECAVSMNKGLPLVSSKDMIESRFKKIIDRYIDTNVDKLGSKIIFFVGPTGVGKTTTIAKLAAHYSLNEGKKIGLISADTYRIAAVEQLKTYSDILNIPLEVIYHYREINQAVEKLKNKDMIMVDTAGRSHKNVRQIKELENLLNEIEEKEIYLVVSCTTKNADMKEIIETYQFLKDYKIIFTKVDEAVTFGTIFNTVLQTQRPLSYITTGQSVPDDIEIISIDRLISLLMKEV